MLQGDSTATSIGIYIKKMPAPLQWVGHPCKCRNVQLFPAALHSSSANDVDDDVEHGNDWEMISATKTINRHPNREESRMFLIVRPLFKWQAEANYWTSESHLINCTNRRSFIESVQRLSSFSCVTILKRIWMRRSRVDWYGCQELSSSMMKQRTFQHLLQLLKRHIEASLSLHSNLCMISLRYLW